MANEAELLGRHGHEVRLWSLDNAAIAGAWAKLKTAYGAPYSQAARRQLGAAIAEFAPDVAHVHNFFPLITPSAYDACRDAGVPVVQTLHNYRTICANGLLFRAGRPCQDCIGASPYQAVVHACYRESRLGSLAVARMVEVHRRRQTWARRVDRFIALSAFAKDRFAAAGFPAERIVVKPNFVPDRAVEAADRGRVGALFVGRLSAEKGVHTLLQAWRALDEPLRVVGDGPLFEAVSKPPRNGVSALGRLQPREVAREMARAAFLVLPSECYETFGITAIEAFCQGLPVIASGHGAMAEIVRNGATGLHFTAGDAEDLAAKVRWAVAHPDEMRDMGRTARCEYEARYAPEVNYRQLMAIYEQAAPRPRTPA